jgi:hypothetical protein
MPHHDLAASGCAAELNQCAAAVLEILGFKEFPNAKVDVVSCQWLKSGWHITWIRGYHRLSATGAKDVAAPGPEH